MSPRKLLDAYEWMPVGRYGARRPLGGFGLFGLVEPRHCLATEAMSIRRRDRSLRFCLTRRGCRAALRNSGADARICLARGVQRTLGGPPCKRPGNPTRSTGN